MKKLTIGLFAIVALISTQSIKAQTLDEVVNNYEIANGGKEKLLSLKSVKMIGSIDVQGYEGEVLKGASKSLSKIPFCFLEVSLVSLYEGEILFLPILNMLKESGHTVVDVFRGVTSKNGQLLQLDILTKLTVK